MERLLLVGVLKPGHDEPDVADVVLRLGRIDRKPHALVGGRHIEFNSTRYPADLGRVTTDSHLALPLVETDVSTCRVMPEVVVVDQRMCALVGQERCHPPVRVG